MGGDWLKLLLALFHLLNPYKAKVLNATKRKIPKPISIYFFSSHLMSILLKSSITVKQSEMRTKKKDLLKANVFLFRVCAKNFQTFPFGVPLNNYHLIMTLDICTHTLAQATDKATALNINEVYWLRPKQPPLSYISSDSLSHLLLSLSHTHSRTLTPIPTLPFSARIKITVC